MKYVAYYRVSTEEQGNSGLGLKAQETAVRNYIDSSGELVAEFRDIESGASEKRQGMLEAIKCCKDNGAVLVVKEMSRISRGGFKYRQLMEESKVDFIECSSPHDPEFVKDIKFSLAKDERKKIRQRTKDALGEIKSKILRGEVHISKNGNVVTALGKPENLTESARIASIVSRKKKANEDENNIKAAALILSLEGTMSFRQIRMKLNQSGFKTSRGNEFSDVQVRRLYLRFK